MGRITPIRSQAVLEMVDARLNAERLFYRNDGRIDSDEQAVLDEISLATSLCEFADLTRRLGEQVEDGGMMTPWGERLLREFLTDHPEVTRTFDRVREHVGLPAPKEVA